MGDVKTYRRNIELKRMALVGEQERRLQEYTATGWPSTIDHQPDRTTDAVRSTASVKLNIVLGTINKKEQA